MKILQVGRASLTNREVFGIVRQELADLEARHEAATRAPDQVRGGVRDLLRQLTSARGVAEYLERCYGTAVRADEAALERMLAALAEFPLTEGEVLQILNLAPCDPVFFYGICRDCDRRLTEEQVDRLCDLVRHHLHGGPPPVPEGAAAGGGAVPITDA
mmetsp:Transcript_75110/g.199460  ORF Transcript_75110/g.199460 Transcript_75110/m.199460 type:complete len:159 (-) Transcript_75110:246-722(-)|eukprot:CAMPEP_0171197422 /NCGR_PEP_ID=MMETSP0790-20130122/22405_1 /TAXON_ID=2925 /ORGANISM="Alexandrium catenella, Strain OF101" /LENGTH=158 /DNA_ID=CAMNT_0011662667 /DNA_START=66 /DNA_END=542 /DNA_ORIENTATION=-